jgi:hypothetical protein
MFDTASRILFRGGFRHRGPLFWNCRSIAWWRLALVMPSSSVAIPWPSAHWSPTPHGFCVSQLRLQSSIPKFHTQVCLAANIILDSILDSLSVGRLGTVAGSPRENPRSFWETFLGLVETTSLHLFPSHRTAPSRHIHAASVRSLYRLQLTAFPAHPPQEGRVCAERIMKEEVINSSTSPEASSNSLTPGDGPPKKKQKRNKPTLSCEECVERKTKVRCCPCFDCCRNTCVNGYLR